MKRIPTLIAGAAVVAAIAPASSSAATIVGDQSLGGPQVPTKSPTCGGGTCTLVHPNPAFGMVSPVSGVITKWRIKNGGAYDATGTLRVVEVVDPFEEVVKGIATANPPQVLSLPDNQLPARLPITAGQSIAVDVTGNPKVIFDDNFLGAVERFLGGLPDGETQQNGNNIVDSNGSLALQATVEPDADADGFGDETQDPCLGDAANACKAAALPPGSPGAPVGLDRTPPRASASFSRRYKLAKALRRGVKGKVTSNESGRITAQLERKLKRGRKTRTSVVATGEARLGKPGTSALKLKFGPTARKSLAKLGKVSLTLRITVRDDAGNPTVVTKRISLKK
ncbi:MAG: hypothetical protein H0T15_04950 [Thermoleophilaceae bacterium]|nr:hypothetical protein [Thermoleophilaceae bacterium]